MLDHNSPLVSIGIPTYNRALSLVHAVESALAQDYPNLEIVVSDNASTDETNSVCAAFCMKDRRIRYVCQPRNLGMTENFRRALASSRGEFFMWLSDDDWLDPSYLSQCMHFLENNRDYVLVCGTGRYYKGGKFIYQSKKIDLTDDSRVARVLSYYRKVDFDGVFFGVARFDLLASLRMEELFGGDWLFSAALAYLGKIKMLESTSIHRSLEGASQDLESLGLDMGMSRFRAKNAHLAFALAALGDIGWISPTYNRSPGLARLSLGVNAALSIIGRFYLPILVGRARRRARASFRGLHRVLDRHLLWRIQARADKRHDR